MTPFRLIGINLMALSGLTLILYLASSTLIGTRFQEIENQEMKLNVERAIETVLADRKDLSGEVRDWAQWDSTFDFVAGRNPDYEKNNLLPQTFKNLDIDIMIILRLDGTLVYAHACNGLVLSPVPASLQNYLQNHRANFQFKSSAESASGIIRLPEGPLQVAAGPIMRSDETGPITGALLMGRYLNSERLQHITQIVRQPVSLVEIPEPLEKAAIGGNAYSGSQTDHIRLRVVNEERTSGLGILHDMDDTHTLALRIEMPRTISREGRSAIHRFTVWLAHAYVAFAILLNLLFIQLNRSRARSEEALRRLAAIVQNSDDAMVGWTLDGIIENWNPAAERMYGYRLEEVQGKHIRMLIPAKNAADIKDLVDQVRAGQSLVHFNIEGLKKDGSRIDLSLTVSPLRKANGEIIGVSTIARDITEQKANEAAQLAQKQLLDDVFQNIREGIGILDKEEKLIFCNPAYAEIFGRNIDEMIGRNILEFFEEELREQILLQTQLRKKGSVSTYELPFTTPKGEQKFILVTVSPRKSKDGSYLGACGAILDITAMRIAEQEKQKSEARYRTIFDQAPIGIAINRNGNRLYVNPTYLQIFGYSHEKELIGISILDQIAPEYRPLVADRIEKRRLGMPVPSSFDCVGIRSDGSSFHFQSMVSQIELPDGVADVNFLSDITDRKKAEEALRKAHNELEIRVRERTADLMQLNQSLLEEISERHRTEEELRKAKEIAETASHAKSQFLANMSHEIRTPLNAIMGFGELITDSTSQANCHTYSGLIISEAEILMELINDLLDMAKIEAGKMTLESIPFDLNSVLESIGVGMGVRAAKKNLGFKIIVREKVPLRLRGDPVRLRQILVNLVSNGIKFTDQGFVMLTVDLAEEGPYEVLLRFEVEDTGIGIPLENQTNIFDSFVQADGTTTRKYGGTGLGTAIAKQLVIMMGGRIWVKSEVGKGSRFCFTVRLKKRYSTGTEQESPPVKLDPYPSMTGTCTQGEGQRLLLAEDYLTNREVATAHLTGAGYQVDCATNGKEAIELLVQERFDLVLMDIQMPEMDGLEATRLIRASPTISTRIPIIGLTANASKGDIQNCLEAGMNDVITKPFRRIDLLNTVRRWLQESGSPVVAPMGPAEQRNMGSSAKEVLPIDYPRAINEFEGKTEVLRELLEQFIDVTGKQIMDMEIAAMAGEFSRLRWEAHKIVSSAGSLTAGPMTKAAETVLQSAKEGRLAQAIASVETLKKEHLRLVDFLKTKEVLDAQTLSKGDHP